MTEVDSAILDRLVETVRVLEPLWGSFDAAEPGAITTFGASGVGISWTYHRWPHPSVYVSLPDGSDGLAYAVALRMALANPDELMFGEIEDHPALPPKGSFSRMIAKIKEEEEGS